MKNNMRKSLRSSSKKDAKYDAIIIGSGTAGIYAARKRMRFLLVSENFGGQFLESGEILNYPGIKEMKGFKFSSLMEEQLKFNGVKPVLGVKVEKIEKRGKDFSVKTSTKNYFTRSVIITTGARAREL